MYERGSKIDRNCVFDCHLCDKWQSKTLFLTFFYLRSSLELTFSIADYQVCTCLNYLPSIVSLADILCNLRVWNLIRPYKTSGLICIQTIYDNVSSMRHIYGTPFDNTGQHIFLKTDDRNQGDSGRLTVYVQPL